MIDRIILDRIGSGEENAVPSAVLESVTDLTARQVRQRVEALRRSGAVICSSEKGYFYPTNRAELLRFIAKERSRAASIMLSLRSAEKSLKQWRTE